MHLCYIIIYYVYTYFVWLYFIVVFMSQFILFVYVLTDTHNCPLSLLDIAVGAPYADAGSGRVYIYHGSAYGINTKPAQVKSYFPLSLPLSEFLPSDSAASLYFAVYGLS